MSNKLEECDHGERQRSKLSAKAIAEVDGFEIVLPPFAGPLAFEHALDADADAQALTDFVVEAEQCLHFGGDPAVGELCADDGQGRH